MARNLICHSITVIFAPRLISYQFLTSCDRKSATNCAWTYMMLLLNKNSLPEDWLYQAFSDGTNVYDAFIILSLLEDHLSRQSTLIIPHIGNQSDHLIMAMTERNSQIRIAGQSEINHYCQKCT